MSTSGIKNETKWVRTTRISHGTITSKTAFQAVLNIEISELRLRFSCELERQCIWLEDYTSDTFMSTSEVLENLRLLVFDHPILSISGWKAIHVLINFGAFTFVPESLFRKEYTSRYLQLSQGHPILTDNKALYAHLSGVECYCIFQAPSDWLDFFQDHFALQQLSFSHLSCALITGSRQEWDWSPAPRIHMDVQEGSFIATVFENQQLILCNKFPFQNPEEATFFVLSCLNQLDYLPEGVRVTLSGETTPFSGLFAELSRFIPTIAFTKKPTHITYAPPFNEITDHRYFALLNASRS